MMNYIIILYINTIMATYVTLQFNNGEIKLSTSSFLFKRSKLFQSFDKEEDNYIPIICSRSYIIDENNACLFDDKTDLSFMFTLQPNKFLEVCKFLDIICYENDDILYSKEFITYIMTNIKEEINIIKYFMQPEIRSIMNYINNEDINIQIKSCTPTFYDLYLTEYKEEVIIHNRIDIYELQPNKDEYYGYMHKYNNHITQHVKEISEYNDYIEKISKKLIEICRFSTNLNRFKILLEQGAKINFQDNDGYTPLHYAARERNNLEVIQYLVEHGANIHLQSNCGLTILHFAAKIPDNLNVIQYLIEKGANIHTQTWRGDTPLHYASRVHNNLETIKYLVKLGANIHLHDSHGSTALHNALYKSDNLEVVQYLVKLGANIHLKNKWGDTVLSLALSKQNNDKVVRYLRKLLNTSSK